MDLQAIRAALKNAPRLWVLRGAIILCILFLTPLAIQNFDPLPEDFIAYWAVGRLVASGDNPYSLDAMLAVQQSAGYIEERPVMVWYPPWTLPLFVPFGFLPFRIGWLVWFSLDLGLILFCADWLWRYFGGAASLRWLAWSGSLLTSYSLYALTYTQATPWMLLGLVLFLRAIKDDPKNKKDNPLLWGVKVGLGLFLISIKPQALALFWILLGLWMLKNRRLDVLLAGASSFLIAAGLITALYPPIWEKYLALLQEYPPDFWATPTLGFIVRQIVGMEHFWLQYLGAFIGFVWAIWYWRHHQRSWNWDKALPAISLASLITATHTWTHDQVLLIPAQMTVMVRLAQMGWTPATIRFLLAWIILQISSFFLHFWISDAWFFWQAPAIALLFTASLQYNSRRKEIRATNTEPPV